MFSLFTYFLIHLFLLIHFLMTWTLDPGINHGNLLTPDPLAGNSKNAANISPLKTNSNNTKLLVKQKSLGRTLSTSVLRIKKKRSFWSQHHTDIKQ